MISQCKREGWTSDEERVVGDEGGVSELGKQPCLICSLDLRNHSLRVRLLVRKIVLVVLARCLIGINKLTLGGLSDMGLFHFSKFR